MPGRYFETPISKMKQNKMDWKCHQGVGCCSGCSKPLVQTPVLNPKKLLAYRKRQMHQNTIINAPIIINSGYNTKHRTKVVGRRSWEYVIVSVLLLTQHSVTLPWM
jgi:hypothetical protein